MPQRPTLNPITADEARSLTRPLEQRALQPIDLGDLSTAAARLPGVVANGMGGSYFDESSLEPEQRRTSILDTHADWTLPPATARVANKENAATAVAFPWDVRSQQAAGNRRGRRINRNQQQPALVSPALPVFIDAEFQSDSSNQVGDASGLSGTACAGLALHAQGSQVESKQLPSTPVDRHRGARQRRRAPLDEEDELAFASLAADLSGLRLRDEPPAKKMCLPGSSSSSSSTAGRPSRLETVVAADASLQRRAEAGVLAAQALTATAAWTALETPPRRPGRNEATASMVSPSEPSRLAAMVSGPSALNHTRINSPHRVLPESERQRTSEVVPWESDPGFLQYGIPGQRDSARLPHGDELNALNALGDLFPSRSGRTASSRLFVFED